MARNHYELLGVPPDASHEEIRTAYRRLARRYHPDTASGGNAERFQALSDAYEVLHDPARRDRYDRSRAPGRRGDRAPAAQVPYFSSRPSARDVPRFLDEMPTVPRRRPTVRVQFSVRWLRW